MERNQVRALWALVAVLVAMAWALALLPAGGHDQLWFLLMAQRWLHSATLYGPEIFDSNTPAVVWASAVPVWVAERTCLAIPFVAKTMVVLLEVVVGWFALQLVGRSLRLGQRVWLAAGFVLFFAVITARDFGQRDQLAALLCLPYLTAVVAGSAGLAGAAAGLLAGVGVCLKPQQALVVIGIELLMLGRSRGRSLLRAQPWMVVAVGLCFLGAVKMFAPLFFTLTLPTVLSTYWAIGHLSAGQLLGEAVQLHVLLVGAVAAYFFRRRPGVAEFLVAGLAATLAYYVQGTGWYYQQIPAIAFFGMALVMSLLDLEVRVPRWAPGGVMALGVLAVILTLRAMGYPAGTSQGGNAEAYGIATSLPGLFEGLPAGAHVATLTTSVDDAIMPVYAYRFTWAQRMNNLWLLPAILRAGDPAVAAKHHLSPARVAELATMQRRWMVEDLQRWKPERVLVDRCQAPEVHCQVLEDRHDDLLAFFLADGAFRQIWAHYQLQRRAGPYDAYVRVTPY